MRRKIKYPMHISYVILYFFSIFSRSPDCSLCLIYYLTAALKLLMLHITESSKCWFCLEKSNNVPYLAIEKSKNVPFLAISVVCGASRKYMYKDMFKIPGKSSV